MITTEDLADIIRVECDVKVDENNRGKNQFSKNELLLIVAKLNIYKNKVKDTTTNTELIKKLAHEIAMSILSTHKDNG